MTIKIKNLALAKRFRLVALVVGVIFSFQAIAEEESLNQLNTFVDELKVTPERCVALRQGQLCYQHVIFDWQAKKRAEYCLFLEGVITPVNCWSSTNVGQFKLDFQSKVTRRFILRSKNSQIDLASTEVVVAWVYGNKKRRRASWRLF